MVSNSGIKCERDPYKPYLPEQVLGSLLTYLKGEPNKGFLTSSTWIVSNSCIKCERDPYRAHMSEQVLGSPLTCLKGGPYKGFLTFSV
jgi:hypothetical protein